MMPRVKLEAVYTKKFSIFFATFLQKKSVFFKQLKFFGVNRTTLVGLPTIAKFGGFWMKIDTLADDLVENFALFCPFLRHLGLIISIE